MTETLMKTWAMGSDDKKILKNLVEDLNNTLKPENGLERMLVDKIISNYWRLQKIYEMENASTEFVKRESAKKLRGKNPETKKFKSMEDIPANYLMQVSKVCNNMIDEFKNKGTFSNISFEMLAQLFNKLEDPKENDYQGSYKDPLMFIKSLQYHSEGPVDSEKWEERIKSLSDENKEMLLNSLILFRNDLETMGKDQLPENIIDFDIESRLLPFDSIDLTNLRIRYETSLENGLYKALHELQRVQSFRLDMGAKIPVAVDITTESRKN